MTTTQTRCCRMIIPAPLALLGILSILFQIHQAKAEWILTNFNNETCASACAARGSGTCIDTININALRQVTSLDDLAYVYTVELGIGIDEVLLDSTYQFIAEIDRNTIPTVLDPFDNINAALYPELPFTDPGTVNFGCGFSAADYGLEFETQRLCCCGSDPKKCPTLALVLFLQGQENGYGKKSGSYKYTFTNSPTHRVDLLHHKGKKRGLMAATSQRGEEGQRQGVIISSYRRGNNKNINKPTETVMKYDINQDENEGGGGAEQSRKNAAQRSLKEQRDILQQVLQQKENRRAAAPAKQEQTTMSMTEELKERGQTD